MRAVVLAFAALVSASLVSSSACAQEEGGANAMGGDFISMSHHEGDHEGPVGIYLRGAELRNWPQGSRRPRSERQVRERSAAIFADAGVQCDILTATNPGVTRDRMDVYEIGCAQGLHFLVVASDEPALLNCLHLAATAANQAGLEPDAAVPTFCLGDGATDARRALGAVVGEMAPDCIIQRAAWVGRIGEDHDRYEVSCQDGEGFWLDTRVNDLTPVDRFTCREIAAAGQRCRFSAAARP